MIRWDLHFLSLFVVCVGRYELGSTWAQEMSGWRRQELLARILRGGRDGRLVKRCSLYRKVGRGVVG